MAEVLATIPLSRLIQIIPLEHLRMFCTEATDLLTVFSRTCVHLRSTCVPPASTCVPIARPLALIFMSGITWGLRVCTTVWCSAQLCGHDCRVDRGQPRLQEEFNSDFDDHNEAEQPTKKERKTEKGLRRYRPRRDRRAVSTH